MQKISEHPIILFDGVCNFCNGSVNFIIDHDSEAIFLFTPLQGERARELLGKYGVPCNMDSFILIKNDQLYEKSDAVLEVIKDLDGYWYLLGVFRMFPKGFRDAMYNAFASKRYVLFGKKEQCMMPTQELRKRFLK